MAIELVDAPRCRHSALLKLDLSSEKREEAQAAVALLRGVDTTGGGPRATVGFSARFFRGPWSQSRDLGGRRRFGAKRRPPACLRAMRARGDNRSPFLATPAQIAAAESDLIVVLEADDPDRLRASLERLRQVVRDTVLQSRLVLFGHHSSTSDHPTGHGDGLSNLDDLRKTAAARYHRYIYIVEDSPRDHDWAGGTYLAFRRYQFDLERWLAPDFQPATPNGRSGQRARDLVIGRESKSGRVIDADSGQLLRAEPDCAEGARAPVSSHIRHANPRGRGVTQFGSAITARDVRIRRRSFWVSESEPNWPQPSIAFLSFQADIQRGGFEYINNQWLMPGGFLGGADPLLDPRTGVATPIDGCYYLVPGSGHEADVWL